MENNQQLQKNESGGFVAKMINSIETFEKAKEFGQFVIQSGYAPKHFEGKPEAVILAIDAGQKIGLDWFQSLQEGFIVNGIPGYKGKILKALVLASGVCVKWETELSGSLKDETRTCTITYQRKGGNVQTRTYSVDNAKQAQLWGKKKKYNKTTSKWEEYEDSWCKYPEDMLEWKCVARVLNDFADITKGFRPIEDLQDYKEDETTMTITTKEGLVVTPAAELKTETSNANVSATIEKKAEKKKNLAGATAPKVNIKEDSVIEDAKIVAETTPEPEPTGPVNANGLLAPTMSIEAYEEYLKKLAPKQVVEEILKNKSVLGFTPDDWKAAGFNTKLPFIMKMLSMANQGKLDVFFNENQLDKSKLVPESSTEEERGLEEQVRLMDKVEESGLDPESVAKELGYNSSEDMYKYVSEELLTEFIARNSEM